MIKPLKLSLIVSLSFCLSFSSFIHSPQSIVSANEIVSDSASPACKIDRYQITLMDNETKTIDSINDYDLVEEWTYNRPLDRTGYTTELYVYDNTGPKNYMPDGTYTYWQRVDGSITNDSWPDTRHNPADHAQAIIDKYGQEIYDKAIEKGIQMAPIYGDDYLEYDRREYAYHSWQHIDKPTNGERSFSYYQNRVEVFFELETCDDNPPPIIPPGGTDEDCGVEITEPTISGTMEESHMQADPIGKILEDLTDATSSEFDVLSYGIPTDEYLYLWGESERYLADYQYLQKKGKVIYTIPIEKTYNRTWEMPYDYPCGDDICPGTTEESDSKNVKTKEVDEHDYSYWEIGHLVVYELQDLTFENYALPNGIVVVNNDKHYIIVRSEHSKSVRDHVFPKGCTPYTLPTEDIGTPVGGPPPIPMEEFYAEAKAKVAATRDERIPDVKNDYIHIQTTTNGLAVLNEVFMDNTITQSNGPTPKPIPKPDRVALEKNRNYIEATKVNKWKTESSITANYKIDTSINLTPEPIISFKNTSYDGKINTVTVHTPVVMYGKSSDDKKHDQRTNPPKREDLIYTNGAFEMQTANEDEERHAYILDRPFTVVLPTIGQHLDEAEAPGYGKRDYAKYYKTKQVRFPFDVYSETKALYFPKDTWVNIPVESEYQTFFMPVWVPEGEYTIDYRAIAINAPEEHVEANEPKEHEANLNKEFRVENEMMDNHIAYDTIEVDVVGRLYDMRITDVLDFEWQDVFRSQDGLLTHTGRYYWVGNKTIDGELRGNNLPYVLPVRHGSHGLAYPNEKLNVAIKTGYQFRFDFKTKGTMFKGQDAIRITPSFDFVDKNGNREPVDIYYHDEQNKFIKIGSNNDKAYREIELNDILRGVPSEELKANADYIYRHIEEYSQDYKDMYNDAGEEYRTFEKKYVTDMAKRPISTGSYGFQVLTQPLSTFIGPEETQVPNCNGAENCTMVPAEDIIAREQHWYGEYSLPAKVYVVEKQVPVYDENGIEIPQVDTIAGYGKEHRLNDNAVIFKRNGYIVVNFNIETIVNGDTKNSHLTYHTSPYDNAPLNNQWKMEGAATSFTDGYGITYNQKDGDMVYYHADRTSLQDFNSNVTH